VSWVERQIGDFAEIKHGFPFEGQYFADNGDYVVLTPGNCHENGGFRDKGEKEKFYAGPVPEAYLLSEGDLLVVMTDLISRAPVLGGSFFVPANDRYLHNQRLGLVQVTEPTKINRSFLFYLFNTHGYRGQIRGSASGATVRHTSPNRIKACKVRIPSEVREQAAIANILSAYDALIENNRRRIALLEEAARMLYREWFVHFRFPGHEHVKIIDGLPEGWERQTLIDLAAVVMGQSPESKFYNETGDGLPFHQGVTDYGFRYVTHRTYSTAVTRLGQAGDILLSVRAPVGRINLTRDNIVLGRGLSAIRSRLGHQSFLFYALKNHFYAEDIIGTGAIYAATNKKELEGQLLIVPPQALLRDFEDQASQIDRQIGNLTAQVEKLAQARDLLLPRLMNGEIAV
jgi:type I restriction enzyme S subunit